MPAFASLDAFVDASILRASTGMPAGTNPYWGQRARILVLAQDALHQLADQIARDTKRRHLLQKAFSITLDASGIGTPDSTMLTWAMGYGSVRDADGNVLVKIDNYNDFLHYQLPFFGYYCLKNDQVHTRAINSGGFTNTASPLTADCSYVPLATEIPDEIQDNAIEIFADLIKAQIPAAG